MGLGTLAIEMYYLILTGVRMKGIRSSGHILTPNTSKQTCLNRIFFTGPLLYVCVGFVCVQIKLFHSHSHITFNNQSTTCHTVY